MTPAGAPRRRRGLLRGARHDSRAVVASGMFADCLETLCTLGYRSNEQVFRREKIGLLNGVQREIKVEYYLWDRSHCCCG
jgi:hypothetical protein